MNLRDWLDVIRILGFNASRSLLTLIHQDNIHKLSKALIELLCHHSRGIFLKRIFNFAGAVQSGKETCTYDSSLQTLYAYLKDGEAEKGGTKQLVSPKSSDRSKKRKIYGKNSDIVLNTNCSFMRALPT